MPVKNPSTTLRAGIIPCRKFTKEKQQRARALRREKFHGSLVGFSKEGRNKGHAISVKELREQKGGLFHSSQTSGHILAECDTRRRIGVSNQNHRMRVAEIWRYPVKSLAGETIDTAEIRADGIAGDRRILVYNEQTRRLLTSRTHPKLLGLKASLGKSGEVLINGHPWDDSESRQAIIDAAGPHARLIEWDGLERFDVLPLLVATDGAIREFGYDRRRLRPNMVIEGVQGLAEREWPGRRMQIGEVQIEFAQLRGRCVMTTYDPDTQKMDPAVLRHIVNTFDGTLALDTAVLQGGRIAVGDPAEFVDP